MFKLGFLVNPFAGIGGSVALKGSDGHAIRDEALARGAQQLATQKASVALQSIPEELKTSLTIVTASGDMGETAAVKAGFDPEVVAQVAQPSEAEDTRHLIKLFEAQNVDMILFAGGDGTARDVYSALQKEIPVLGIPAGCKIHSGVYAITPKAAGVLVGQLAAGEILSLREASVMDIDEDAFRQGRVKAKNFGHMTVPDSLQFVQATKDGGKEREELVLEDIAADIIENMDPDICYAIGSGTTCAAIMEQLGLENTLLGVDVIKDRELLIQDATAEQLLQKAQEESEFQIILTLIGGQGHILGRGNQQISPQLIKHIGWDKVTVIATKSKLKALDGRPLVVDTGDPELDEQLKGTTKIITGYHDAVIYRVGLNY